MHAAACDCSFPPAARLHDARDYNRVFNRQQKAAGRWSVLLLRPHGRPASRLGIMVSTKVAKRAVRRHQLKRWVRELFRTRLRPLLPGCDCVVLLRADPTGADDHRQLDAELLRLAPLALAARPQAQPMRGGRG